MKRTILAILIPIQMGLALAACDTRRQSEDRSVGVPDNGTQPSAPDNTVAVTSIVRPAVTNEVATTQPEPAPTPQPLFAKVGFPDGGAMLDDTALDALVADPRFTQGGAIVRRGNSDSRGGDAANLTESRRRAEAVRTKASSRNRSGTEAGDNRYER